jgi:hypothetical protein
MSHGGVSTLNPVETSARGTTGLQTFLQDQTTATLDVPFLKLIKSTTLAADTVVDNRTVTLGTGHGAVIGNIIEIADPAEGSYFLQCAVTGVAGDVVTLDCPVNRVYLAATALVSISTAEMNVNGSVTPQVFTVLPFPQQSGDMVRMIVEMRDDAAMAFDTFGGLPPLANGVVVRVNNGDGTYRNMYNFKTNGDIIEQAFDHSFQTGVGGSVRGFTSRITWGGQSKRGVVIRLDGAESQAIEIIVQDDLTGLIRMHWTCNGHELQEP